MAATELQQPPKLGQLRTRPYSDERWETVNVELTEKQLLVKYRDVVYEDTMASNEIIDEKFITLRRKNSKFGICIQMVYSPCSQPSSPTSLSSELCCLLLLRIVNNMWGMFSEVGEWGGLEYRCPIKINRIVEDSVASQCGEMDVFNVILEVNGISMWGRSHSEASKIIQESGEEVTFHIGNLIERDEQISIDEKWLTIADVPTQMASLTKYKPGTDILRPNAFEVTSRNGRAKTTLLCKEDEFSDWINTISRHIKRSTELEIERYNSDASREEQIVKMGWVYEDLPSTEHTNAWCRKLLVLKRTCIQLFEIMPDDVGEWERAEQTYSLLEITVQVLPPHSLQHQRANSLALTSGTGFSHVISCETTEGLVAWTRDIHHTTVEAVKSTKRVDYSGIWRGREVYLVLDIHQGILLSSCSNIDPVIELEDLQLAICGLECFMATKVAMLDPQFIQEKTDIIA